MAEQIPSNPTHASGQPLPAEPESLGAGSKGAAVKRSRPMRPVFAVGIVLAAVATVVVATLPNWLVSPAGVRQFLLRSIPELKGDIRVEAASIGWFSPLSIRGLGLIPADGSPTPISVEQIRGDHGLLAILMERGRLGRIDVTGLTLDLVFDEQHVSNLQQLLGRPPKRPVSGKAPGEPPASTGDAPVADEQVRVVVADAKIRVHGPWTKDRWESEPIDLEATLRRTVAGDREWSLAPVTLLDHARLEPSVAAGVLAYAAPILADATRTGGEFSLVIDEARWPAGRGEEAIVSGMLTLHKVDVGPGPLVEGLVRVLPGRLPAPPTIRVAEASRVQFRQANRRVWHEGLAFGIPLVESGERLDIESAGSVGLDDRSLDLTLSLPIPADLPQERPLLAAIAGKTLRLRVAGNLDEPQLKLDESLKQTVTAVAGDVLENLRQQRSERAVATKTQSSNSGVRPLNSEADKGDRPAVGAEKPARDESGGTAAKLNQLKGMLPAEVSDDPTTDAVIDAVGGLLDEVARRRAARKQEQVDKDKTQPSGDSADTPKQSRPARRLLRQLLDAAGSAPDSDKDSSTSEKSPTGENSATPTPPADE